MRRSFSSLAFAACLASFVLAGHGARAETLRVAGTGGAMAMAERIAAEYAAASGTKLEIVPGLGSKGGINATVDGVVDMAISSRPLNADEVALGLNAIPMARTAFVFATSHRKPNSLNSSALSEIFAAVNPKWADGSPINLILRPVSEGDNRILELYFPKMRAALEAARQRSELPIAPTDQDNAELAERLRGSLTQAGLCQIVAEKRNLRLVPIDGVRPTLENLADGKYPYEKIFYLVFSAKTKEAAGRLLAYVRSAEGQGVLRECGSLPAVE